MPYRITECYLPPGRGDIPAFTPAEAGTRLCNPGGMQGLVGLLHTEMVYPPEDVTHPSTNRARRELTSFMRRTPLTTTPRRHLCYYGVESICFRVVRPSVRAQTFSDRLAIDIIVFCYVALGSNI